jgi:hypothetical protein
MDLTFRCYVIQGQGLAFDDKCRLRGAAHDISPYTNITLWCWLRP